MAKKNKKNHRKKKTVKLDSLKQINLDAAGIDIGDCEMWVAVPEDRDKESVQSFGSFTPDLLKIAAWLKKCNVKTVAMESTGVYWLPIFEILTDAGFDVIMVDARKVKNVSGRKTDIEDCQWIQQLHTYGLLSGSFIPDQNIRALRDLVRHRSNLIRYRAVHIQHIQKVLQQMNLKLTNVLSDITGKTGMDIIRAILNGKTDPKYLASFRDPHCRKPQSEIEKSLQGNYKEEYIYQMKQLVDLIDFYEAKIKELDSKINKVYDKLPSKVNPKLKPLGKLKRNTGKKRRNTPAFDLRGQLYRICGVDLTQVDGLDVCTIQNVITDTGTDMSNWKTTKHFCSWLSVCPNNKVSGGKLLYVSTKKTKNRANKALRMAAQSLANSDSALGAFYRRIRAKYGAPVANTATAHKLARIIYMMLKFKVEYKDLGAEYYNQKYKERRIRNLKRTAKSLGYDLVAK